MSNLYKDLVKVLDGPTKLELIKENQYKYKQFENKSNGYDKFRKLVAQNITLPWIKGSNWMGGISDSNYQRGLEKIAKIIGEDPESIFDKVDSEFVKQQNEVDKIQMKDNKTIDMARRKMQVSGWQIQDSVIKKSQDDIVDLINKNDLHNAKKKNEELLGDLRDCLGQIDDVRKLLDEREKYYNQEIDKIENRRRNYNW